MRRPAPEIHLWRFILGAALLLASASALTAVLAVSTAAAKGPISVQAAGTDAVLPTHVVEVTLTPAGGLTVATTGETLERFKPRLAALSAAAGAAPAALLRVPAAASLNSVREGINRLEKAGFRPVFIALEENR